MTAPGYVPPIRPGWWVKRDVRKSPPPAALTLVGSVPDRVIGRVVNPPAGALTLTGAAPTRSITAASTNIRTVPAGSLSLTGGVPTRTIATSAQHYTDDFNRTDSTAGLGASWTAKNGVLGIKTNRAYPVTASIYNTAAYGSAMATDDHQVSVVLGAKVGAGVEVIDLILGANSAGELAFAEWYTGGGVVIYTNPGSWNVGTGYVSRTSMASTTWTTGDTLAFKRVGNVYSCLLNGSAISGATWTDIGNVVPRNSTHRLVGIGGVNGTGPTYRTCDSFAADDI